MEDHRALHIYTDGSAYHNPRKGGIGVRFVFPDHMCLIKNVKDFYFSGYNNATIGVMEIQACISALTEVLKLPNHKETQRVIIHSDSMYVVDNYQKIFSSWPSQKWKTFEGKPILNVALWKKLSKIFLKVTKLGLRVEINWVKGHSKNIHNKAVDKLAKKSAKLPTQNISNPTIVRRNTAKSKTTSGSIIAPGKNITLKIICLEYLKEQRMYKLRAEVISKKSPLCGSVDFVYSSEALRPNHFYYCKFKKTKTYAEIKKVYREVKKT